MLTSILCEDESELLSGTGFFVGGKQSVLNSRVKQLRNDGTIHSLPVSAPRSLEIIDLTISFNHVGLTCKGSHIKSISVGKQFRSN